jgi:hypothetical protein
LDDLFDRELLKRLAETIQGLVEFDRRILHALVGVLGTPHYEKMFRLRDPMLAVAVETDADKSDDLRLIFFGFNGHRASSIS